MIKNSRNYTCRLISGILGNYTNQNTVFKDVFKKSDSVYPKQNYDCSAKS